jgi:hypothetical protein
VADTPPMYTPGWIKQNPITRAIAVRTSLPATPGGSQDWAVMTLANGGC